MKKLTPVALPPGRAVASCPTSLQEEPRAPGAPVRTAAFDVISCRQGWGPLALDIGRREFITLLGGAAIFVYLLSRTFFPMAVRTYSSC